MLSRLLVAATILCITLQVAAQKSRAECMSGFDWMNNVFHQSPCLLAAFLDSECRSDPMNAIIPKLLPNGSYSIPALSSIGITPCRCSTVYYAALQACEVCQGTTGHPEPWSNWITGCKDPAIQRWPRAISSGSSIPAWTYLDVVTPDKFDVAAASAIAAQNLPDSTTAAPATTSSVTPSATPSTFPASVTPSSSTSSVAGSESSTTPSASLSGQENKSNTGPIVGGVVGGIALVVGVVVGVIFFLRARARRSRNQHDGTSSHSVYTDAGFGDDKASTAFQGSSVDSSRPFEGFSRVLYDPENPATFPDSAHGVRRDVLYSGAAEI